MAEVVAEVVAEGMAEVEGVPSCNRFEVYFSARDTRAGFFAVTKFLQERSSLPMPTLRSSLFMLQGSDCVWHLLRVAAGLESLVVGEGQILAQTKACYEHSVEEDGAGGKCIVRLLNQAVSAGKRVRAETAISKGAVSISSAAYEFAEDRCMPDLEISALADARIVIVGAGKMTRLLITHMAAHGVTKLVLCNRSERSAKELADQYPGLDIEVRVGEDEMWRALADCDIAFTSTSATGAIITRELLMSKLGYSDDGSTDTPPMMIVDISVPTNVDKDCRELPDIKAYNVDDLKAVVAKNTAKRQKEMLEAEVLLREEQADFLSWQSQLSAVPALNKLQAKAERFRVKEVARAQKKLRNLSAGEAAAVERMSRGIVNKLLHGPMSHLRRADADNQESSLGALKGMFELELDGLNDGGEQ